MTSLSAQYQKFFASFFQKRSAFFLCLCMGTAHAADIIPASSLPGPGAHTNIRLHLPSGLRSAVTAPSGTYENPMSLACVYGLTKREPGCNPSTLTAVATGGSRVIAIVDAYDDLTATNDLIAFSNQYGLPRITNRNFQIVYATGTRPEQDPSGGGWELEESLDVQMAHALAPKAKIILVEAATNSVADLLVAEQVAAKLVAAAGGGEISNSWGAAEFSGEANSAPIFSAANTVFFAAAGDAPGATFPSVLSNVVAVGGTSINRTAFGDYVNQSAWSDTGGGSSAYVAIPPYQQAIARIVGGFRGVPDVSLVANPSTGVWIYDSTPYEGTILDWLVIGGTSVAAPAAAALVNNAGHFFPDTSAELTEIYADRAVRRDFTDITSGFCGNPAPNTPAGRGWDFCTGVGAPRGTGGK